MLECGRCSTAARGWKGERQRTAAAANVVEMVRTKVFALIQKTTLACFSGSGEAREGIAWGGGGVDSHGACVVRGGSIKDCGGSSARKTPLLLAQGGPCAVSGGQRDPGARRHPESEDNSGSLPLERQRAPGRWFVQNVRVNRVCFLLIHIKHGTCFY